MSLVVAPDCTDVAVLTLPDGQRPFGADCPLPFVVFYGFSGFGLGPLRFFKGFSLVFWGLV